MPTPETPPPTTDSVTAILPAAGSGRRFGQQRNKLFADLAGWPLWYHSAARLAEAPEVGRIIMPISESDRSTFEGEYRQLVAELNLELVTGGAERTDSVRAGLDAIGSGKDAESGINTQWVAIHDAARPLVTAKDLTAVFAAVCESGAAILAAPVSGTLKRKLGGDRGCETVDRTDLWVALTPQVFRLDLLRTAYSKHRGRAATDDAQLVERIGHPVTLVPGSADNLKITHPEDLALAASLLRQQQQDD